MRNHIKNRQGCSLCRFWLSLQLYHARRRLGDGFGGIPGVYHLSFIYGTAMDVPTLEQVSMAAGAALEIRVGQ